MSAGYRRSSLARHLWKTTALTSLALALALSGAAAYGDDAGLWQPQVRAIIGADNNGGNAALEGFIPIKQTAESVLFLDVRAKHDFKDAFGQDIGLGIRRIVNPDLMLGGYAYFNAESYGGSQFTGGTLGVEAITPNFDAHVNVFVPIKGDSADHSTSSTLSMVSNQLIEQISVLDHRDYAAWGIEGEVGAKVPLSLPDKHSLRLDIGGYHFEDPHGDDGSVTGAKAGIEYEIGDVFGTGTSLTFTGEVRNDNRDDTQFAGSVRLNIPFNPGGGSDSTGSVPEPVYPVSEGLRKRVNERVRGDIGVRIQSQDKSGGSTTRVAINAATNAAFGKFYFADGGLAGAGTQADPTTLDDAVTRAGAGGFVVALGGNGNLTTAGVTLTTGQTVIGGGESVTAKLLGGGTATFNLGGSDGTIQGTNVANNVITLGNGNTLNGITITGGADGIFGTNVAGTTLTKVTVTGAGGNGAEFTGNSTSVKASDFTSTNNGLDGLHIEDNGTYNFTGTTLLSGNVDDGLDITGQGTYTFAAVNAQNNADRGITVQGTSSGGTFTTTGGNVSGNGGIGVYIDPITAHVVLDSISQTGGTSGVVLDHVSGSFTVNGATTISGTSGPAIAISDSPAAIRFGDVSITAPAGDGMVFSGVNAAVVAGNIVVSGLGLGHTGLDFSGSQTTFTALSANISGSGAGSIGIDLADTTGDASIVITNGGTISGVDTGVRLGIAGSLAHSANAQFTFGGGSIAGVTASLDTRGLNQTLGLYAFGSTTFSGPQLFDVQNVIFVGAAASGSGDGSSLGNLASIGTADGISDSNAIFVLVNDAGNTPINAAGGFSLSDGQTLASFGNGRSFSLGGVPVNVTGTNIQHDQVISDPGTGAATLTNSGAGDVVTLGNGNSLQDFNISGGSGAAVHGTGIAGLMVHGVTVSNVATGLFLNGVTGAVTVDDLHIQNVSQTGIAVAGSSATVNFTGNTTIANAAGVGLFANNFDGTATFDDLDITGGGRGVAIWSGSSGTLTFGSASSITNTGDVAFNINNATPNVTYNGTINQATAANAVRILAMTGGSATFAGKITASTGAASAIDLSGNAGGTINFTGGLDLTTDGGYAFSAINGGTLTATGTGNTVNTGAGVTENGILIGGASGLTIGTAGVTFASVTVDGSGGTAASGIVIENTSGGNVTFGNVNINRASGDAIRLTNISSGTYTFNGTTTIATAGPGPGFVVEDSAATVSVSNLVTTNVAGADVGLTNNTGTIGIGGTITNSGAGDGVVVSGGSAAITIGATINSSATAPGTAVKVDGITGGSVALTGAVTSTGTGNLFAIGSTSVPTGGAISFTGSALTATGGGGAVIVGLGAAATFNATAPLSITNATGNGVSVSNVAGSATFGAVTVTTAGGNAIDISGNSGSVTFGTTNVTMGAAANTAGINFSGTNADVSFGTTSVTMGAGGTQTGIDFSGSSTTADFGLTTITGTGDLTSRGIDLSSTTGNKTITFLRGSSITNAGVGVELSSGGTTATSANANFTFGDGSSADGLQSSISAAIGGYTVNTIGLDSTLGNYDFDDVAFSGSAHLASAVGGVTMVSQTGGVINAGTDGLSADVSTISVTAADAMTGSGVIFAFVGTVDLSGTPFTLDSGQSITGFGNGNSIVTSGTIQPINVQGNLGATGGNVTGDEGVVKSTGSDTLHLLGSNQVKNTAFDFSGGSGSVFLIDQSAVGFSNVGGIVVEGVAVSNVGVGRTAFKVVGVDTNVSITNNNVNVTGTLLDANGGNGNITVTRGTLPNSATPGTLTGGGISIANRTGGLVNFTEKVTVGGTGVSLINNTGSTVTFADLDISTSGVTAFTASGGGTVNVTTGTINATGARAVALDGITAGINLASTTATFGLGNGIDLLNLNGTAAFGAGTLTNTGSGTAFNVGSATNLSGGNAAISYGGTIASNGTGASVSIQELTGGSVTLSSNLTDGNAAAGGQIVVAGIDNGTAATVTFSGTTKQISSGATDAVSLGLLGNFPAGTPAPNTNGTIDFTNGGLDITTTTGAGFAAGYGGTVSVSGSGNKIASGGNGLLIAFADVGSAGVNFDSISAVSNSDGAGVFLSGANLAGDVNIGGLKDTGYTGASLSALSGTGEVNFTGTIDLDVSYAGFDIGGPQVGTINIANVAGSTLTIDGGQFGIIQSSQGGTVNVGVNGSASITNTTGAAISLGGGNDLAFTTLTYKGSITVGAGSVLSASGDGTRLNMSGSVVSTTSSTTFDFFGHADGIYDISSTIDHSGGKGVAVGGSANGTVTFSGTSKTFNTGANDAIYKAPVYGPDPQNKGTLAFTNGGLAITTTSGAGFTASTTGPGTVSVTGTGNTITTTTGTALNLDGATVGAGGINFDSVSVNGAATGIALNNVSGGTIGLGTVDLQGITSRGVDISGTLGSTLSATSLNIVLGAANAVGLDLSAAALGASNITAGDFDVDGGSFAGTIGIDMAGTTGTGTIQLGDLLNNNPGPSGQTSTIDNVGYGVQFSSATNAKLVFGDGQGPAESSISTTGGQVIHATDSLPTNGDYNFNDVTFSGDTSNLATISVYYVTEGGTGAGSLADPGSYAGAQASTTANVIVLIDQTTGGSQSTIDLAGTTFQLDDGQVLLAFKSGDAAVDVSQLGVSSTGGASGVFHFTTAQNSPIVSAPGGIDSLRPILQSNSAGSVVSLTTSGSGLITGGVQNLIIRNTGAGAGVSGNASANSSFFLRNNDVAAGGRALDFITSGGATADKLLLSIDGNTLKSTGSALAASFAGQNISATDNSIAIRSFANNTVIGGTGGGIAFNDVRFDSDGLGGTVSAGTLVVGTPGVRVQGNGLSFTNTTGTLDLGALSLANNAGTGVLASTKTTNFTLNSSGGSVDTTGGAAFNLDPLTVGMVLNSVAASGGASGIIFDGVAGTFTVTGATTVTGTSGDGISAINTNTGSFNFNTVTVNNVASAGGGIGWASGTLNVTGLANIDTTTGAGLSQSGGTTSFTGGLTIDTTTGTGIAGTGGTMGITATGGAETVTSTGGPAIGLSGIAAAIALDSTSSAGGTSNVSLTNVTGTVGLGGGALSGATGTAFNVNGGSANVTYAGTITQGTANQRMIVVADTAGGTVNFTTAVANGLNDTAGAGIIVDGAAGNVTINNANLAGTAGITILGDAGHTATGTYTFNNVAIHTLAGATNYAFVIDGDQGTPANDDVSATVNLNNVDITNPGGNVANIRGMAGGSVNFDAASSITRNDGGLGIVALSNSGGTINFGGATKTLSTGANAAVILTSNAGATINFTNGGLAIGTTSGQGFNATGGGTVSVTGGGNTISTSSGAAVNLDTVAVGAGGMIFASTNTSGAGGSAVVLDTVTGPGAINLGTGALVGGNLATIRIGDGAGGANSGGTATFSYAGTITSGTGRAIDIQDRAASAGNITLSGNITHNVGGQTGIFLDDNAAGTITFSGASKSITSGSAAGVSLTDNAGAIIDFTNGGLVINSTSGIGFNATGAGPAATTGGTVTVQGSGNTINSTSGTALNVVNATIGANDLIFQKISSSGGTSAGIVLDNTGSSGGLHVTGSGLNIGATGGGVISGKTGADINSQALDGSATITGTNGVGIFLRNTSDVQLNGMQLNDFSNYAILGSGVTGLIIDHTTINGVNGDNDAVNEGSVWLQQLLGTATIQNSSISGGWEDNLHVQNSSGTLNRLTVDNVAFGANSAGFGNEQINAIALGTATLNMTVQNSTFTGSRSVNMQYTMGVDASNVGAAHGDVVIANNTITGAASQISGAAGIFITSGGTGDHPTLTYNIHDNNINGMVGSGINVSMASSTAAGSYSGFINNNTIIGNATSGGANGISIITAGGGTHTTAITNNTITKMASDGIYIQNGDNTSGGDGIIFATVTGNSVKDAFGGFPNAAFELNNGTTSSGEAGGDHSIVHLTLGGAGALQNDFATSAGQAGAYAEEVRMRMRFSATTYLNGYAGGATDDAAVSTWVGNNNILSTSGGEDSHVVTSHGSGSATWQPGP
ncbi:hypothetical protein [Mesorhizobium sp. Cs1321R2N1]|uniref:hypothetical protein n=1 Tax=Mesorhizobium sp. Cs1321R2N1 TaxID=3015174 RepID=UPI00301BEAA9